MLYWGGDSQKGGANLFNIDFSDFAVEYFRKEMSSSRFFFCQMFFKLSAIYLPSLKQKCQKLKKNSGGPKFVHFVWNYWNSLFFWGGLPEVKKIKDSYYLFISFSCSKSLGKKVFLRNSRYSWDIRGRQLIQQGEQRLPHWLPVIYGVTLTFLDVLAN